MKKLINFKNEQVVKEIQGYANSHFDGNFTKAVISMCKQASLDKPKSITGDSHKQQDLLK